MEDEKKIVIDLDSITEQTYDMLGANIKYMLSRMFAGAPINGMIRGPRNKVSALADALSKEKSYLQQAQRYGLDDPRTYRNKTKLATSIKNFERQTGLLWPFK
jgi:hypothetical protein